MKYKYMANFSTVSINDYRNQMNQDWQNYTKSMVNSLGNAAGNHYRNVRNADYLKGIGTGAVLGGSLLAIGNMPWNKWHIGQYTEEERNKFLPAATTGLAIGGLLGAGATYLSRKKFYGH